jgi:hypothetical protein
VVIDDDVTVCVLVMVMMMMMVERKKGYCDCCFLRDSYIWRGIPVMIGNLRERRYFGERENE